MHAMKSAHSHAMVTGMQTRFDQVNYMFYTTAKYRSERKLVKLHGSYERISSVECFSTHCVVITTCTTTTTASTRTTTARSARCTLTGKVSYLATLVTLTHSDCFSKITSPTPATQHSNCTHQLQTSVHWVSFVQISVLNNSCIPKL